MLKQLIDTARSLVRSIHNMTSTEDRGHLPLVRRGKPVHEAETFGCRKCWPNRAGAVWKSRHLLEKEIDLIDESHFHVMILACRSCGQRFVSVFTEKIDWDGGDGAQSWSLMPITVEEQANFSATLSEAELERLGPGRRCLEHDHPTGERARTNWTFGLFVGRHD
jgi:hypothetical protein